MHIHSYVHIQMHVHSCSLVYRDHVHSQIETCSKEATKNKWWKENRYLPDVKSKRQKSHDLFHCFCARLSVDVTATCHFTHGHWRFFFHRYFSVLFSRRHLFWCGFSLVFVGRFCFSIIFQLLLCHGAVINYSWPLGRFHNTYDKLRYVYARAWHSI